MARRTGNSAQDEANDILDTLGITDDTLANEPPDDDDDTGPVDTDEEGNQDLEQPEDEEEGDEPPEEDDDNAEEGDEEGDEPPGDQLERAARDAARRAQPKPKGGQRAEPVATTNVFDPKAKVQTDKAGNLYINGKKIANAGREARLYMGFRKFAQGEQAVAQKMAVHVSNLAAAAKEMMARYEELSRNKNIFEKSGMTPAEQTEMLQLGVAYKKNPVEAIKLMLTRAQLAGVDLKSVVGANGSIDAKALVEEMSGRMTELLKPVITQTSQVERTNKLAEQAKGFFERNPAAKQVSQLVGGSHKLGLILKEAMRVAPDISMDEHFQRLHYAILVKTGGKMPPTGPVGGRRPKGRQVERRLSRNFQRSVRQPGSIESVDEIASSVLADANALTARGV